MNIKQLSIQLVLLLAISFAGLVAVEQAHAKSGPETVTSGVLSVGSDLTYPPYAYLKDHKPAGSDPEFMRLLAEHMDLEPRFVDTRFAQLIIGLRSNRFDVVASVLYITPERAEVIDYVPYMQTGDSLLVLSDGDFKPKTPQDLCGKKVSSIKGASWIPKLDKVSQDYCIPNGKPAIENLEFPTAPEATQALLSHAVDVQFADALIAKNTVEKAGDRLEITSDSLIFPIPVGLGLHKGNTELKEALESAIEAMKKSGEYQRWLDKYNLEPANEEQVKAALQQN